MAKLDAQSRFLRRSTQHLTRWHSDVRVKAATKEATEEYHKRYPDKPGPDIFGPEHDTTVARRNKA